MKRKSIWEKDKKKRNDQKLDRNIETDILIIGGGITGLTLSYFLRKSNKNITLIDKGRLGLGVTAKTTAKITYLQEDIYQKLEDKFNQNISKLYFDSQKEAIELIKKIIKDHRISCDFKKTPSLLFAKDSSNISKINKEAKLLTLWNVSIKEISNKHFSKAIRVEDTYTFHPLKYLDGLIDLIEKDISIYEYTLAKSITYDHDFYQVKTEKNVIRAKEVVIATHYPFFVYPSFIPLKTYIQREYVNVGKRKEKDCFSAINVDQELHSIRFYQDYLIYGSNKNRLTSKIDYQKNDEKSKEDYFTYFLEQPIYTWMNQDIMSNDLLPFIGKVKKNMYLLTAYNAWGMTNATIGAKLVCDLIQGRQSRYEKLFDPCRMNSTLFIESLLGSFHYMKAYMQSLWKKNNPYYIKIKGIYYGIYEDKYHKKHQIKLICPHMKCNLVFNKKEHTWDCPCHGSRFDLDGHLIEGPAKENLQNKK